MRLIATFFTLLALVATGFAGKGLHAALSDPTPAAALRNVPAPVETVSATQGMDAMTQWPNLFGEPQPPKPPTPAAPVLQTEVEPQPPAIPLESMGYALTGVVRAGDAVWGVVSHPTGDQILRVGDQLNDRMAIARIDENGLWVDVGGDKTELLGFAE
ncbi:hypothetical protein [Tateyamaria omphalii]|uniref:Type II secretion system protein GspC N-terminal domain-containing protein n=1 Tax=Tateyamaria omphalii TaxID=299262 RepID=A0A1P8N1V7_9RHOB|nr:hypothetical protein [Tateyamaria omphalii]APX14293.1 hypothetical protein BWR18_20820 [Tateyamaria omphalii]